jgi:hypothetical protein
MGFRSAADGITKQGKTKGRNLGDDGARIAIQNGPKESGSKGGKTNADMKKLGRGMAKVAAQMKG